MNDNKPSQGGNQNNGRPPRRGGNNDRNRGNNRQNSNNNGPSANKSVPRGASKASRGQAIRASRNNADNASKITSIYYDSSSVTPTTRANKIDDTPRLRVIGLGGMDGGGAKNMVLVEYMDEAIVIDCGNQLGVDLPGINFGIPDITYLKQIKHKLKAYVITHGHLDHIGGLPYIVPEVPAPIYGSRFTIGMVEQVCGNSDYQVEGFSLQTVIMNQDNHERLKIGKHFVVELVRVTHSIPDSTAVVIDTPVGRIINTGDFRIDPEPLDHMQTDIPRLTEMGKEGVLLLMSDSTTAERPGRTPSESTLEPSFHEIINNAPGRVFISMFSSNINRIQMVVNSAGKHGRKIALDGRSMMSTLETAVKHGMIKIPKGTFVPMANVNAMKDEEIIVICTGSQGEPNAALTRMANGEHKHVKLKEQDTVVLSATPIPESGNDAFVGRMVDSLTKKNVHVFQHITRDLDGHGPLHVSGHASLDEYGDMIEMTNPKFFIPIYGSYRAKKRHIDEAINRGVPRANTLNTDNGQVVEFTEDKMESDGVIAHGTVLVDETGAIVSNVVVKDRLMMAENGLVTVILTVDRRSGQLMTSPDIVTRGFIYMRDNEELMTQFRAELKRVVGQRFKRVDLDRFKQELKDHITYYLFEKTQRSPIVIPVVNVVGGQGDLKRQAEKRVDMNNLGQQG